MKSLRPLVLFFSLTLVGSVVFGGALICHDRQVVSLGSFIWLSCLILYGVSPAISALLCRLVVDEQKHKLAGQNITWILSLACLAIAVAVPFGWLAAARLLANVGNLSTLGQLQPNPFQGVMQVAVFSILANPWEEIGWRGFAQRRLQKLVGVTLAAIAIGVVSGIWHLPFFMMPSQEMSQFPYFPWFLGTICFSITAAWLYNFSGQRLLYPCVLHVCLNVSSAIFGIVSFQAYAIIGLVVGALFWKIGSSPHSMHAISSSE